MIIITYNKYNCNHIYIGYMRYQSSRHVELYEFDNFR